MKNFRVTSQGSISVKDPNSVYTNLLLNPGQSVPDGLFTQDQLKMHIDSGFIIQVGAPEVPDLPGASMPKMSRDGKPRKGKAPKYDFEISELKTKSLAQLNELVHKKDPQEQIFEDKGSAIGFLTSDRGEQ